MPSQTHSERRHQILKTRPSPALAPNGPLFTEMQALDFAVAAAPNLSVMVNCSKSLTSVNCPIRLSRQEVRLFLNLFGSSDSRLLKRNCFPHVRRPRSRLYCSQGFHYGILWKRKMCIYNYTRGYNSRCATHAWGLQQGLYKALSRFCDSRMVFQVSCKWNLARKKQKTFCKVVVAKLAGIKANGLNKGYESDCKKILRKDAKTEFARVTGKGESY